MILPRHQDVRPHTAPEHLALWPLTALGGTDPAGRHPRRLAWPTHRALELVALGHIVLVPGSTGPGRLEPWKDSFQARAVADQCPLDQAEERAVGELLREGLAHANPNHHSAAPVDLTPAGRALRNRWANLQGLRSGMRPSTTPTNRHASGTMIRPHTPGEAPMPTTTPTDPEALAAALRAQAAGTPTAEAAAELVIFAGWLTASSFTRHLDYSDDPEETGGVPLARVRWNDVLTALETGALRGSGGPERTLRLAASLGGGKPVDLRDNLRGLGSAHAAKAVEILTHAITG